MITPARASPARYRGRFAPSPTGPLHFGSLVAALASYCDARSAGGDWLVRIEDVDMPRTRRGASEAILATLERYGFAWDGPVEWQSRRIERYQRTLARLRERGLAYSCACTRRELQTAPLGAGGERIYPGTCRDGVAQEHAHRAQRSVRVRVDPADAMIEFRDRLLGRNVQDVARDVGDFVVLRADGLFAYQLAVVVDDAEQAVNAIVRGADLLASTARQIWLQRALGYPTPSYLHVPVALDAEGAKLSKQTGAAALPATALVALRAAWSFLDQPDVFGRNGPASVAEFWAGAIPAWTPARLPPVAMLPAPAAFDPRLRGSV